MTGIQSFSRTFLKRAYFIAAAFGICIQTPFSALAQERCASAELLKKESAVRRAYMPGGKIFETQLQKSKEAARLLDIDTSIYIVPVVVHIIHYGEPVGTGANLTDEVVKGQIEVLNEDFRRKTGTNGFNSNPAGSDARIEFQLATCDTNGNYTTGITRTQGRPGAWSLGDDAVLKGQNLWPVNQYLNVWVCDLEQNYLGYSTFPIVQGIPSSTSPSNYIDGVVIDYNAFGKRNQSGSYNLGRTLTHEIGHYLSLIHVWGDEGNCAGDDYCPDTPIQEGLINSCPAGVTACPSQAAPMIENYMQYTYDRCMNVYTNDQVYRMRYVLRNSSRRIMRDSMQLCTTPVKPVVKPAVEASFNPTNNTFVIQDQSVDTTSPAILKLYSLEGRLIRQTISFSRTLHISTTGMANGLYLIKFERGNARTTIKVRSF